MTEAHQRSRIFPVAATLLSAVLLVAGCTAVRDAGSGNRGIQQDHGERTLGSKLDDENIEEVTMVNVRKASPQLRKSHVYVVSYNGVVLLLGQVATSEMRQQVAQIATKTKRVRMVNNAITVEPETSFAARSYDTWLTTKVKAKFANDNNVPGSRIKVVTENGVIYLMGLLTQAEANRAVSVAQTADGAQRIVKAFEYID